MVTFFIAHAEADKNWLQTSGRDEHSAFRTGDSGESLNIPPIFLVCVLQ